MSDACQGARVETRPDRRPPARHRVGELRADGFHGFARRCGALKERSRRLHPMLTRTEFEPKKQFDYLAAILRLGVRD